MREDAARDYEEKLLGGAQSAAARPALSGPELAAAAAGAGGPEAPVSGELFVSLDIAASEAGELRDAVAGLGASAAFRPDTRFAAAAGEGGAVRVSGWIPASRLADAIAARGVRRVAVERGSRPARAERTAGDFLVGLRVDGVPGPARDRAVADAVRSLESSDGFRAARVIGVETAADGRSVAVVAGSLPLSSLSSAMGRPGVLSIVPAPSLELKSAGPRPTGTRSFFDFIMTRGLWLVGLTALLALPTLGAGARRLLLVFSPYR
jgi:hypothetical protein